jgi:predicted peptidase
MGREQGKRCEAMKKVILILLLMMFPFSCYASSEDESFHSKDAQRNQIYRSDKTSNTYLQELIKTKAEKFEVRTYSDDATGLVISYDIYFPENYSHEKKYPVVFFIGDASCAGKEAMYSVTQGLGALVWTEYECVVIVPTFPEVIIDDHNGFTVSKYVDAALNLMIRSVEMYSIDSSRIYATGQSMGCMTSMLMASRVPEFFTACLFVSGQWNINDLDGITSTPFIYAASYGDDKASKGQREVLDMCIRKKITYTHYDNVDAKSMGIGISTSQHTNFITFRKGTTLPKGTEGNYSEHMSSFDYVYADKAVREWLLSQKKGDN